MAKRQNSLDLLLPSFKKAVIQLVANLEARGFDPMVFETGRSAAREKELDAKGAGSAGVSMHFYGAAVDIISRSRMWDWPEFYESLCEEAEKLGMTSGHRWRRVDSVHCQALPVNQQATFRRLKAEDRDAFIRPYLKLEA